MSVGDDEHMAYTHTYIDAYTYTPMHTYTLTNAHKHTSVQVSHTPPETCEALARCNVQRNIHLIGVSGGEGGGGGRGESV